MNVEIQNSKLTNTQIQKQNQNDDQIFFSKRCPLLNGRLSPLHKWLYTNGTWSYFCTVSDNRVVFAYLYIYLSR